MKKIILIIIIFFLTGCYDYNELNDLEIVSSMIVDYKDDEYEVNLEVINTNENGENGSFFLKGTGKNIESAINNVYFESAQTPFFSQMKALIISDSAAEKGIEDFYDYFLRSADYRKDFYFFVCEKVDDLLEYKTEKGTSIGDLAKNNAERNHEKNGRYKTNNFREIVFHYLRNNNYLIGNIGLDKDELSLDDSYLFVDGKKDMKVERDAALLSNLLDKSNTSFQIFLDNSFEIHEYKIKTDIKEDKITLTLTGSGRISNSSDNNSLDEKDLEKINKALNEKIEKLFKDVIDYSLSMDKDMFHFNYYYYQHYPKKVENDSWKNVEYEVKSDVKINEKGLLLRSLGGN